ncbi:sulfite exporter TauE/SafE family protein [Aliishimia ponticola]|uniref:Probable membrane transporter protein n=1 Tax=Aliishimia ponticola TaxID=2499833 RepID=A0A4S4NFB0_9RHOB|nr:sulfite exporter TauE/SafE family protein [Aliishimia ponticola]THH38262.1 sulfite exporter TauE/SafE family protein [Aliishimia ponticola]
MPDILAQALAVPGLGWLVFGAAVGGMVRGFSGFGTAMVFLPIAAQFIPPAWAILCLIAMDIIGPLPVLRRTARQANLRDLALLTVFAALSVPLGVWLLTVIAPETYRLALCGLTIGLVVCLVGGLRYSGKPTGAMVGLTGAASGVSGGLAGLPGPPVVLLYMASSLPVAQVRANAMLFLFIVDFLMLAALWAAGAFALTPMLLGAMLAIPNTLGILLGQAIFDPGRAGVYRGVAYGVIMASAVMGLPFWDQ